MSDADQTRTFLSAAGWDDAQQTPLAGDASRRQYRRLARGDETAVLMISPPTIDPSLPQFLTVTRALRLAGLSAPDILHEDRSVGLALLEDLGPTLAQRPEVPGPTTALTCTLDAILDYAEISLDVPVAKPETLRDALDVTGTHYPGINAEAFGGFSKGLFDYLKQIDGHRKTLSLRDVHAGNLTWLPARSGSAKIGLLDYQDAFMVHPVYDLVSLLKDARVEYPKPLIDSLKSRYAQALGIPMDVFSLAFDVFTLQRNTRILGLFCKLAIADGRTAYLQYLPHVRRTLDDALANGELGHLRADFACACPPLAKGAGG